MAKTRRKRSSYSESKRTEILAAAQKEGLTAAAVQKRFGVTPVTYYSWRKKYGASRRRGGAAATGRAAGNMGGWQANMREMVVGIVRAEVRSEVQNQVNSYLSSMFGGGGARRRGRPRKA